METEAHKEAADNNQRKAEEALAEAMLAPAQAKMTEERIRDHEAMKEVLEKAALSFTDLERIHFEIQGYADNAGTHEETLTGTIEGVGDKPNHAISITYTYHGGKQVDSIVGGIVDGKPISKDLAQKIYDRYYYIAYLQKNMTESAKKHEPELKEEVREIRIAEDLL